MKFVCTLVVIAITYTLCAIDVSFNPLYVVAGSSHTCFTIELEEETSAFIDSLQIDTNMESEPYLLNVEYDGSFLPVLQSSAPPDTSDYVTWFAFNGTMVLQFYPDVYTDGMTLSYMQTMPVQAVATHAINIDVYDLPSTELTVEANQVNLVITPGLMSSLSIESAIDGTGAVVSQFSLQAGESRRLYSIARDLYGNFIQPVSASWNDAPSGSAGLLPFSFGVNCMPTTSGFASIEAEYNGFESSCVCTISPADPYRIRIENTWGDSISQVTMTCDEDVDLTARVYDQHGNEITGAAVEWELDPDLYQGGSLDDVWHLLNGGKQGRFTPTVPCTGAYIRARVAGTSFEEELSPVDVEIGYPASATWKLNGEAWESLFELSVDSAGAVEMEVHDADGNQYENPTLHYEIHFPSGCLAAMPGTEITAFHPGDGYITVECYYHGEWVSLSASPTLRFVPGEPDSVVVFDAATLTGLEELSIACHEDTTLTAVVYDQHGNEITGAAVEWELDPDLYQGGSLDDVWHLLNGGKQGRFTPIVPCTGAYIRARVAGTSFEEELSPVDVEIGYPASATWKLNGEAWENLFELSVDSAGAVEMEVHDADGNQYENPTLQYEIHFPSGCQATMPGTEISAEHPGDGYITVECYYHGEWISLSASPTLRFVPGEPDSVVVFDAATLTGLEELSIACHEDTTLKAVVYDQHGNEITGAAVEWELDPDLYQGGILDDVWHLLNGGKQGRFTPIVPCIGAYIKARVAGTSIEEELSPVDVEIGYPASATWKLNGEAWENLFELSVDAAGTVEAEVRDEDGNLHPAGSLAYEIHFPSGCLAAMPGTEITAFHPGDGYITVECYYHGEWVLLSASPILRFVPGEPDSVVIYDAAPPYGQPYTFQDIAVGTILELYAHVFDQHGNLVETMQDSLHWSATPAAMDEYIAPDTGYVTHFAPDTGSQDVAVHLQYCELDYSGATFEVYDAPLLSYVAGSFSHPIIPVATTVTCTLQVMNITRTNATVDLTESTTLYIAGEVDTLMAQLSGGVTIADGQAGELIFPNMQVPADFPGETYTAWIDLRGVYQQDELAFSQQMQIEPNGICITNVVIDRVWPEDNIVYPGSSHEVYVQIRNCGLDDIEVIECDLALNDGQHNHHSWGIYNTAFTLQASADTILPFTVSIGTEAVSDTMMFDARLQVQYASNDPYPVPRAFSTESWTVVDAPVLQYVVGSLQLNDQVLDGAGTATQGQPIHWALELQNTGSIDVLLSPSSILEIDAEPLLEFQLTSTATPIPAGSTRTLSSSTVIIPEAFSPGGHPIQIILIGTDDNQYEYADTLSVSETLLVQTPATLSASFLPGDWVRGFATQPSVRLANDGGTSLTLTVANTYLTYTVDGTDYTSTLSAGVVVAAGGAVEHLFAPIEVATNAPDNFSCELHYEGVDANGMECSGSISLMRSVTKPAQIDIVDMYTPQGAIIDEPVSFHVWLTNVGEQDLTLDAGSSYLSINTGDSLLYLAAMDQESTLQVGQQTELTFSAEAVPAKLLPGNARMLLRTTGTDPWDNPFVFQDSLDVTLEIRLMPLITSVEYIDGGYSGIPNGAVDGADLLRVHFDRAVLPWTETGADAPSYFSLVGANNSFGSNSIVVSATDVGYHSVDADSLLFIELGDGCSLKLQCTNLRFDALAEQSYVVINPEISQGLLRDEWRGDAGYTCNQYILQSQYDAITQHVPGTNTCAHAVYIYDPIPPFFVRPAPMETSANAEAIPSLCEVTVMVTGRNIVPADTLRTDLLPFFSSDDLDMMFADPSVMQDSLLAQPEDVQMELAEKYRSYWSDNREVMDWVPNPFAAYYNAVPQDSISFVVQDELGVLVDSVVTFHAWDFDPWCMHNTPNLLVRNERPYQGTVNVSAVAHDLGGGESPLEFSFSTGRIHSGLTRYHNDSDYSIRTAPNPLRLGEPVHAEIILEHDAAQVAIIILDAAGNVVVVKHPESATKSGRHLIRNFWDGCNARGKPVSQGLYLCLLEVDEEVQASWYLVGEK